MEKEINPWIAGIIILTAALLFIFRGWVTGEIGYTRIGAFFLEKTSNGNISIQVDHHLVVLSPEFKQDSATDLRKFGAFDLMSNVSYFSNGDILLRQGDTGYGLRDYFSAFSFRDNELEKLRSKIADTNTQEGILSRCNLQANQCSPLERNFPKFFRSYIATESERIFITSTYKQQIFEVQEHKEPRALNINVKFPKRIRKTSSEHNQDHYVVDTNNHRIVFFDPSSQEQLTSYQEVVPEQTPNKKWTVDAIFFSNHWWVINADFRMQDAILIRLDSEFNYVDTISLPKNTEPLDLIVINNELLVSDTKQAKILRLSPLGEIVGDIQPEALKQYSQHLNSKREYYSYLRWAIDIIILIAALAGLTATYLTAKKHNQEKRRIQHFSKRTLGLTIGGTTMLISNIEVIPNKRITKHMGLVQGSTVRAKHAGKDILAGLKNIVGGELKGYTELLQESRQEALDRMGEQAQAIGANAVINVRFATSAIAAGASEILAYGTAVYVEEK